MIADSTAVAPLTITGPKGYPIIGNLPDFINDKLGFFTRCAREYGEFVPIRLGHMTACLVNAPHLIEEVLNTKNRAFIKDIALQKSHRIFGTGLLTSEGDHWKRQRRLAQPAFHRERLGGYAKVMIEHTERMLADWRDREVRDISAEMTKLTLSIVAKTLFDVDSMAKAAEIGNMVMVLTEYFIKQLNSGFFIPEWLPLPGNLRFKRACRQFESYIQTVITKERSEAINDRSLLAILLQAQDDGGMSDNQLLDEIKTIFLAGHETTSNSLSWTWLLLAQHPDVAAELTRELETVLADRLPTVEDLPKLRFTESVINESMRLYPPAWNLGREAIEQCRIGDHPIAVGTTILMSPWVVHHNPQYYPEPDKFLPSRWQGNLMKSLPPFAYFPFGGGPRLCIGKFFALTEVMLILSAVMQRFEIELLPGQTISPEPSITLRPIPGIKVKLHRR